VKVYVKKEDKNTMIPGIIVTIIFLLFSLGVFIAGIISGKSFIDLLSSFGIVLIFAIIFFGLGMYFVYALIKSPKGYKVKLVNKKIKTYNGKQIIYMEFNIEEDGEKEEDGEGEEAFISADYKCYTFEDNNLIVGNAYLLRIKEFNWEPKYVEEISNSYEQPKNKVASNLAKFTMSPVLFSVGLFFGGLLLICILGIIMYPQYTSTYIILAIFCIVALFIAFKKK